MMEDKALDEAVKILAQITKDITVTGIDMPRCAPPMALAEKFARRGITCRVCTDAQIAVREALLHAAGVVCVCGSLYLAGDVRKQYRKTAKSL